MSAFITILTVYALYAFSIIGIIFCVQKRDRLPAIVITLVFPAVLIAAFFVVAFKGSDLAVRPCPDGLEEAEALVERKRQQMFQGPSIEPNIAKVWRRRYAMSVELQTQKLRALSLEIKAHFATI